MTLVGAAQTLLTLLLGEEQAARLLEAVGVCVITSVLDTDIIIRDLSRYIQTGKATSLMMAARFGSVKFFASTSVQAEVPLHINRVTDRRGIDPDEARRIWREEYEPLITFLDPGDMVALSPRASMVDQLDAKDTATGQLIDLIQAQVALSDDHHLIAYTPVRHEWTQVAVAFRDIGKRDSSYVAVYTGGGVTIWVGMGAIQALIALLRRVDRRILLGLGVATLVIAGFLMIFPGTRRWLIEKIETARQGSLGRVGDSLISMVGALARMDEQAKEARAFINDRQVAHDPPRRVSEYMVEILSHTHAGCTPEEISRRMIEQDYKPKGEHPERYVAKVLRENPKRFERLPTGLWILRSARRQAAS
jgi:hypothetical protein